MQLGAKLLFALLFMKVLGNSNRQLSNYYTERFKNYSAEFLTLFPL